MINSVKAEKMLSAIKDYKKKYLSKNMTDLDESGTRIMINNFLTSILGYQELEEIKTEFMIKGTYADYIVQIGGKRHFLVEVKAFSLELSDKHLRQAVNYGANEGIEWALLTNGRQFQFYKILFEKPISEHLVFSVDFTSEEFSAKEAQPLLEYFYKDAVLKNSLSILWSRYTALEPAGLANMLFSPHVITFLKKELRANYETKFEDDEIIEALTQVICSPIPAERLKIPKYKPVVKKKEAKTQPDTTPASAPQEDKSEEV